MFPNTYSENINLTAQADLTTVFNTVAIASDQMRNERVGGGSWYNDVTEKKLDIHYGYMEIGGLDNVAEYNAIIETKDDGRVLSIKVSEIQPYCSANNPKPTADVFTAKIKSLLKGKNLLAANAKN